MRKVRKVLKVLRAPLAHQPIHLSSKSTHSSENYCTSPTPTMAKIATLVALSYRRSTYISAVVKQGASAANYRSEFDSIAQYLTWDESALRSQYYEGLKADVKDALSYCADEPEDYKAYQDLTIRLDDRIYERKKESRTKKPPRSHAPPGAAARKPSQAYTKQTTTYVAQRDDGPQPMDLDGTRSPKFKPLTNAEKQRRREHNLCLYCGGEGHRAGACPNKTSSARIQATIMPAQSIAQSKNE